jgi:fatty acid desaturase
MNGNQSDSRREWGMRAWIKDVQKFRVMMSVMVLYMVTLSLALLNRDTSWAPWFLIPLSLLHLYFYGIIHELSHNTIFAQAKTNVVFGRLLCPLNLVSFHTFKTVHLQHHRFAQIPALDPVCTLTKHGKPFNPIWYLIVWPYYAVRWYARHIIQHPNRRRLVTNYVAYTAGLYSLFGLGYLLGMLPTMLFFWALPVYLGTVFVIGIRNLIEHYGCEASRYRSSRTVTSPLLNKLTFNSFYHLEHHLWPGASVPQLRELHERNRELYREKRAFIV